MKVINIPILGSFVKYSDYENQSKILQDISKNNEELYQKVQKALLRVQQLLDTNTDVSQELFHEKETNVQLYEDNTKLYSQLKQAETNNTKALWMFISLIIVQTVLLNLIH